MHKKLILILSAIGGVILIALIVVLLTMMPKEEPEPATPLPITEAQVETLPQQSPEEVIRAYFDAWNNKDIPAMVSFLIEEDRYQNLDYDVQTIDQVDLRRCQVIDWKPDAASDATGFEWLKDAKHFACVETDYTLHNNSMGQDIYMSDTVERDGFRFWLMKTGEGEPWRIAMQGY